MKFKVTFTTEFCGCDQEEIIECKSEDIDHHVIDMEADWVANYLEEDEQYNEGGDPNFYTTYEEVTDD